MIKRIDKPTEQQLYTMELHEYIVTDHHDVTRVIGGWIYESRTTRIPVFVPMMSNK